MDIPVELNVVKFELSTWLIGLYLLLVGLAYFLIFRKHHKRNEVEIFELVNLVTKFFVITTVSIIIIVFGIDFILMANQYIETRSDVIAAIITGILLISATIINYIFYLKRALKDYEVVERQENKKRTLQIGEWLQLIFFVS
jgi:small-conductance mechanosensitive channel